MKSFIAAFAEWSLVSSLLFGVGYLLNTSQNRFTGFLQVFPANAKWWCNP